STIGAAQASILHFEGDIANHNDIARVDFSLAAGMTDVSVWTDSSQSNLNFDPLAALWNANTGERIAENDDNASINLLSQTAFDSGFHLTSLAAGDYFFTLAVSDNFAVGSTISKGFSFDGTTPIPLADWTPDAKGTHWSIWLNGVDAIPTVPIPGTVWLLGSAMLGLMSIFRHKTVIL
ncbi:MAG: DVUA0089 family protein, partial [Methylococcales bacterium]|nr:DVUA0089 family protein [Methylococcales bacterium]